MRLEIVHLPQPVHCGFADFLLLGHEPTTPMRHPLGFSLQSGFDDCVSLGLVVARFAPASGCNLPDLADAQFPDSFPPSIHRGAADLMIGRDDLVRLASKGSQNDPAT